MAPPVGEHGQGHRRYHGETSDGQWQVAGVASRVWHGGFRHALPLGVQGRVSGDSQGIARPIGTSPVPSDFVFHPVKAKPSWAHSFVAMTACEPSEYLMPLVASDMVSA